MSDQELPLADDGDADEARRTAMTSETPAFTAGDRVYVTDPGLAMLRDIMRRTTGKEPAPNHHGTVNEVWDDGSIEIWFDNEDGEGQGQSAPYPPSEVKHLVATRP